MLASDSLDVLVVDDSDFFVSVTADKLGDEHGIATRTANSGAEALSVLEEHSVDCVVSDYQMPEMNGLELYRRIDDQYGIPFVMVTGEGDEMVASHAMSAGVDEYFKKDEIAAQDRLELLANRIGNVVAQRRARNRYEMLVDNTPDEIVHVDTDGTIVAANSAMATSFGTDESDLIGQQLGHVIPGDVAQSRIEEGKRAITAGSAVTFQDDIGVRHFHNIAVPITEGSGGDSFQLISRDITQQKRRERELAATNEELAVINRLVRHDINNDVQLLLSWAEVAKQSAEGRPWEYLDRIEDASQHISELTTVVGDIVDSIAHGETFDLEPTSLKPVVTTEIEKRRTADDATISVVGDVPSVDVYANELLRSVVGNLLSNAVRHNDSDDPTVWVTVEEAADDVILSVADDGPGIPDDQKDEIFGKGEMGTQSPGTGIGLYLVNRLAEAYGGSVRVEDRANTNIPSDVTPDDTGAVFSVQLPKHAA
ncbi:hybrid sensor histidine kinase/response regulator [Halorientalis pallida]|uniref:histidine kinase n=1 Tax=Halorientalis pallida TaxID=2479928 RepID=A0A498L4S0_9EURY|nr:ATP-binding protein [Halorientalis pallida]RXK49292.1 response regulator [Halorientalis pallida]